jgi:hypothetical protein
MLKSEATVGEPVLLAGAAVAAVLQQNFRRIEIRTRILVNVYDGASARIQA